MQSGSKTTMEMMVDLVKGRQKLKAARGTKIFFYIPGGELGHLAFESHRIDDCPRLNK